MSPFQRFTLLLTSIFLWFSPRLALAQPAGRPASVPAPPEPTTWEWLVGQAQSMLTDDAMVLAARVVGAICILLVGWIVARLFEWVIFSWLQRATWDDRLAERLGVDALLEDENGKADEDALERIIGRVVFWIVMLIVLVAAFETMGLGQAAAPIEALVSTVMTALPLIGKAVLILLLAFILGSGLRKIITLAVSKLGIDRRVSQLTAADADESDEAAKDEAEDEDGKETKEAKPFSETTGAVAFWLVMVVGLAGAFDALHIEPLSGPLRNALDQIVGHLPSIGVAVLLVIGGWILGRIVRAIVSNLLKSVGFDKLVEKIKLDSIFGEAGASHVLGIVAMVFVVLQAVIAALDRIGLATLSEPLTDMMARFWELLPTLTVSVLVVAAGVLVGRLLRGVVATTLRNLGFDKLMARMGFEKIADREDRLGEPSELAGFIVHMGVILVAIAQALSNLELDTWATYVDTFLTFAVTKVVVALLIVGVGFLIGNYVRDFIHTRQEEPGQHAPKWMGEFARYAILVFAFTMGVQQLGVAENFVLLSFALLFGSLCLAAALAFGLGSREVAGEIVQERWKQVQKEARDATVKGGGPSLPGTPKTPSAAQSGTFKKPEPEGE